MALKLYYKNSSEVFCPVSTGDSLASPITTTHNGKTGDEQMVLLYIRNDNSAKWYSNIRITPVDLVDPTPYGDVGYTETGWGVKLSKSGLEPTQAEWEDIIWGDPITIDNIGSDLAGDHTTYSPFWYLISCPPNTNAQNKTDIALRVEYTENTVSI
jgi:hypothetical protein